MDNILNEYIKCANEKLLSAYIFLFNSILETGYMPESWLKGTIHPTYKGKGQPSEPNSYRPIYILACLDKLFTAILNLRITKFIDDNKLLGENQAGFRKNYSCSDHRFTLYNLINILKNEKSPTFLLLCGFFTGFWQSVKGRFGVKITCLRCQW